MQVQSVRPGCGRRLASNRISPAPEHDRSPTHYVMYGRQAVGCRSEGSSLGGDIVE